MPTSTRDRLVQTAHQLFYTDGFHTVGLDRILAEVGVTKTTFYNHFESKEDLVLEVLRQHDGWWREEFTRILRRHGGDSARGQLLAVCDAVDEVVESEGYNGCLFVNVAVQFPLPHDPVHLAAAEHKRAMERIIRELARAAGAKDPLALAQEVCMVMDGAYVSSQITGEPRSEVVRRLVRLLVDRHVPVEGARAQGSGATA